MIVLDFTQAGSPVGSIDSGTLTTVHADLQRLMAPEMLDEIRAKTLPRLRDFRQQLTQAEGDVSFVRRVTQGRLDIVGHEVSRRDKGDGGEVGGPEVVSASGILFEIPDILTDAEIGETVTDEIAHTMPKRMVQVMEPGDIALALIEELDGAASPGDLAQVEQLSQGGLADLFDRLRTFEVDLSSARRTLHDRIDRIQEEIARRYRDGETTVDALLEG